MRIKAVLLDLDGTLVNTIDDLGAACNYALDNQNLTGYSSKQYKLMVGNGIKKLVERSLDGRDGNFDRLYDDFMKYYSAHSLDKTRPYDGFPEVVRQFKSKGIKTAVITNKAEAAAKLILNNLYPDCFDYIQGQKEGFACKPDPASVLFVINTLGVSPDECVFVGDSMVDMQTAVNAGILPIGVTWGFRDKKELLDNGAKFLAETPKKLEEYIFDL